VLSHAPHVPRIESRLTAAEVECVTLETLLRRSGLDRVDLLVIDTEGYDWEIIRSIDFEAWRPRLLVYEQYHLSPEDRNECRAHLRTVGYETMEEHFDTFCLDSGPDDSLTRLWRRITPAVQGVAAYEEAGRSR
jgi:hypothetical protein